MDAENVLALSTLCLGLFYGAWFLHLVRRNFMRKQPPKNLRKPDRGGGTGIPPLMRFTDSQLAYARSHCVQSAFQTARLAKAPVNELLSLSLRKKAEQVYLHERWNTNNYLN